MKGYRDYEEVLKTRYIHLYGQTGCNNWVRRERNKNMMKVGIIVLLFICVVYNSITVNHAEYSNVKLNKYGEIVEVKRPDEGQDSYSFATRVKIISDNGEIEKEYYITIEPAGDKVEQTEDSFLEEPEENKTDKELKQLVSALNEDKTITNISLPDHLESGEELVWMKVENTDPVIYFIGMLFMLWLIYHSRFQAIGREEKKARESIIRELPEFINKLVLLINAGVILNAAFLKIVDDCDERKTENSYFYRRIVNIGQMVQETNASFHNELYSFAKYSGVKEMMRITNIMLDNISKGDNLSDKLRRENELLWFARRQQAEEKGKLAETKLTLPLMMLLMVLIIVTIAPALMEM